MIGERIQQARKASGLSLRALAEKAGVTAMAISKYENNQSTPSSDVLLALAKALGVRVEYFFRQAAVKLEHVEYRHFPGMPEKEKGKIEAYVQDQAERWVELEAFVPTPWSVPFNVPENLPPQINNYDEIEEVAVSVREAWNLGLNPVPDLTDTFESYGIIVFAAGLDAEQQCDGLAAKANGKPVIVVNKDRPGDRQRFTLAHELGHLVLKGRLVKGLHVEMACNRFAGAFLVPKEMVFKALGQRRTWLEPQELALLKAEYGLSMGGWTYRARDLGILPQIHMRSLWNHFHEHGWDKKEPDPQYPQEKTRLFKQLIYRALAEDLIGESKAAEMLGMSLKALHACRNMECPDEAAANQ
jgi:Zn-dependent peptidase ImmA (M78 family)/transcriptional regulator with XRE-family HTH domain